MPYFDLIIYSENKKTHINFKEYPKQTFIYFITFNNIFIIIILFQLI